MARVILFLCLLLSGSALAQPAIPDTAAGNVLAAWLAAYNSAERTNIEEFRTAYGFAQSADSMLSLHRYTGEYKLLRIEQSDSLSISALLEATELETIARRVFTLSAADPHKIASTTIESVPRPTEFAIPRMTQKDIIEALSARISEAAGKDDSSGAMLIAHKGTIVFQKAWGLADRQSKTPVTLDTKFRLGSVPKMFTGAAVLQLVSAGKLSMGDTIGRYLSDYPNRDIAAKVTIRELLNHTGGTGDIFGPEFTANRATLMSNGDYVALYGARAPSFEPGTKDAYSNYGFVLLGALIEKVSGTTYYDYLREHVFRPAGMNDTGSLPESENVPLRSTGYMRKDGVWVANVDTLPYRGTAAGGGYSTVGDLLRFANALEAGTLLPEEILNQATSPQNHGGWYGYGFQVDREGDLKSYGHDGGAPGMNASFRVFPRLGTVVLALSNFDPPAAESLMNFYTLRMPISP